MDRAERATALVPVGRASFLVADRGMVKARTAARARSTRRPRRRHLRPRSRRGAAGHRAGKGGAPSLRGRPRAPLGTPLPRTLRAPLASFPRRRLRRSHDALRRPGADGPPGPRPVVLTAARRNGNPLRVFSLDGARSWAQLTAFFTSALIFASSAA